jgi:hypothetical protein
MDLEKRLFIKAPDTDTLNIIFRERLCTMAEIEKIFWY